MLLLTHRVLDRVTAGVFLQRLPLLLLPLLLPEGQDPCWQVYLQHGQTYGLRGRPSQSLAAALLLLLHEMRSWGCRGVTNTCQTHCQQCQHNQLLLH